METHKCRDEQTRTDGNSVYRHTGTMNGTDTLMGDGFIVQVCQQKLLPHSALGSADTLAYLKVSLENIVVHVHIVRVVGCYLCFLFYILHLQP